MPSGNEGPVGEGIRNSGIPRKDLFITTKLTWVFLFIGSCCTIWNVDSGEDHGRVFQGFETSLSNLGCEYIDLFLMHWPQSLTDEGPDSLRHIISARSCVCRTSVTAGGASDIYWYLERYGKTVTNRRESFLEYRKTRWTDFIGKVKSIGVSNFSIKNLDILLAQVDIVPAVNQVRWSWVAGHDTQNTFAGRDAPSVTADRTSRLL